MCTTTCARSHSTSFPTLTSDAHHARPQLSLTKPMRFIRSLLLLIYFVGAEQGATSMISGMYVHEFVHDGRHLLGFPCH